MKISSFDIFDTCLVRKCGSPENFLDILSLRAFNGEVEEWARQEFAAARYLAQRSAQSSSMKLQDIWDAFDWKHPQLKTKDDLIVLEQQVEREMLVPVLAMQKKVKECRAKGHHIIFISDMYLSSSFLCGVMHDCGFMQEGDSMYVSCECNAEKWNGELFKYVHDKEHLSFRQWYHYGDNAMADYRVPCKLGIKATRTYQEYTPYQQQWASNDYSLGFKYRRIMAGLGRAMHHSTERTTHTDFVLDIIAPFYSSLVYRMLKDAVRRRIKRLYFCARDAYTMYRVALRYQEYFPQIDCRYLYVSRQSIFDGDEKLKLQYFIQEGLATNTDKVAIVDVRSQGKTQYGLNDFLVNHGYNKVFGYYYEMFVLREQKYLNPYNCEANSAYLLMNKNVERLFLHRWELYENFFSMNDFLKTADYAMDKDGKVVPVFTEKTDDQDNFHNNKSYWMQVHNSLIESYVDEYIRMGLMHYSDNIFENVCIPTLTSFMLSPKNIYLEALTEFYAYFTPEQRYVPYIKRLSLWELIFRKGKSGNVWNRGSMFYSIPEWLADMIISILKR